VSDYLQGENPPLKTQLTVYNHNVNTEYYYCIQVLYLESFRGVQGSNVGFHSLVRGTSEKKNVCTRPLSVQPPPIHDAEDISRSLKHTAYKTETTSNYGLFNYSHMLDIAKQIKMLVLSTSTMMNLI